MIKKYFIYMTKYKDINIKIKNKKMSNFIYYK